MSIPWPMCAVCGTAVERLEQRQDPLTADVIVFAYCHGDREETRLDARLFATADVRVRGGVAFAKKAIAG